VASRRLRQLIPDTTPNKQDPQAVSGSRGRLAYSRKNHDVHLYWLEVASGEEKRLTSKTGEDMHARFSPDGQKLAYQSNRTGHPDIWLLDLATDEEINLTDHPGSDRLPDWSPDGRQILFVSDRGKALQLWVMNPEGGASLRLSEEPILADTHEGFPRWSPDGARIGYLAPSDRGTALWVVNRDGTNARPLLFDVIHFEWYLDDRRVVYSRMGENGRELRAADLESGDEALLLSAPHAEHRVSLDGSALTYGDGTNHMDRQVFLLRLSPPDATDGLPRPLGEPVQLTEGGGMSHIHSGGWSPDGTAVVFSKDTDNGDIYVVENYQ